MYAALLALLFIALSVRTLRLRATLRIAIGDGGNERLLRASRVHGNFAEGAERKRAVGWSASTLCR
jgi:uncharacterized membrane protein YecN with MAPEG domain